MIITPHALVGAGIGTMIDNLPLVFILGFFSHFILDAIPHVDQGTLHHYEENYQLNTRDYILIAIDGLVTLLLLIWIINSGFHNNFAIIIGSLGGITPDLICHVPLWKNKLKKYGIFIKFERFHRKLNHQLAPKYWYWGVITQLVIVVILLNILL